MQVRYYFDDDVGQTRVVADLRRRGIDCVTSLEADSFGLPDEDHLLRATELGRALCTGNRGDFSRLHTQWMEGGQSHAGIVIIVRHRYSIGELGRRLYRVATEISAEDMCNRTEYLNRWGISD